MLSGRANEIWYFYRTIPKPTTRIAAKTGPSMQSDDNKGTAPSLATWPIRYAMTHLIYVAIMINERLIQIPVISNDF